MFRKLALTAAAFAVIVGGGLTANTQTADAGVKVHLGFGGGYYGGGYGYGHGRGYYRPVYQGRRCFRTRSHKVRSWSRSHGHWHTKWKRGRRICRY